jgi:predicted alpha/beta hydrolase family esterase
MLMLSIRADDSIVPTVVALAARLGATAVETGSGGLLTDASGIRRWREMREQELG